MSKRSENRGSHSPCHSRSDPVTVSSVVRLSDYRALWRDRSRSPNIAELKVNLVAVQTRNDKVDRLQGHVAVDDERGRPAVGTVCRFCYCDSHIIDTEIQLFRVPRRARTCRGDDTDMVKTSYVRSSASSSGSDSRFRMNRPGSSFSDVHVEHQI